MCPSGGTCSSGGGAIRYEDRRRPDRRAQRRSVLWRWRPCRDVGLAGTAMRVPRDRRRYLRGGEQRGKALGHRLIDSLEEMAALGQERADGVTHRRNRSRTCRACERIDALHAAPVSGRSGSVGTVTTAIEVEDLSKSYGDLRAVDGVSFSVEPGEVFAILGPNGPESPPRSRSSRDTAVATADGFRPRGRPHRGGRAFRNRIGIVLQEAGVDKELTVRETLDLYSTASPVAGASRRSSRWSNSPTSSTNASPVSLVGSNDESISRSASSAPDVLFSTSRPPDSTRCPPAELGTGARSRRQRHHHRAHHPLPRRGRGTRRSPHRDGRGHSRRSGTPSHCATRSVRRPSSGCAPHHRRFARRPSRSASW